MCTWDELSSYSTCLDKRAEPLCKCNVRTEREISSFWKNEGTLCVCYLELGIVDLRKNLCGHSVSRVRGKQIVIW